MKKRILSLVLALAMCFSMVNVFAANDDEAVLMGEIGDLVDNYRDRIWTWQGNQFDAMTEEQVAVIDDAWASYEANKDDIKAIATQLAENLATDEVLSNETMKDLYKWKLMRDIMEGKADVTSDDAAYQDWLARFTAFEMANDEAISPSQPTAALGGLGSYSADLTTYFSELAEMVINGLVLEGEDADKANNYINAALKELGYSVAVDEDQFNTELKADVVELAADGMFNVFDIGMQVATNQINEENTNGIFEMIPDRDMKAAFLILGEDFVRYLLDGIFTWKNDLFNMNKEALVEAMLADTNAKPQNLLNADNSEFVNSMYGTMKAVANYVASQPLTGDPVGEINTTYGIVAEDGIELVVEALRNAMTTVDANHGLELVHFNTYMGREMLRYNNEGELVKLNGAEIDAETVTEIMLGFAHDRYPVFENTLNKAGVDLASFDVNFEEDGFKVYSDPDGDVGNLQFEITEDADGTVTVNVFRGYSDSDFDGVIDYAEDVYRYVASFAVTAEGAVATPDTITLDDIADFKLSEQSTIIVKGTTTLDNVVVSIALNGEEKYVLVHTKAEFEAGIELEVPEGAVEGDVFTVAVGENGTEAEDTFTILAETVVPPVDTITLDDIADFKLSEQSTITVKGTTTLDNVVVSIALNGEEKYVLVHTKAEFEAGIVIEVPEGAAAGDVFTVAVGENGTEAEDTFTILAEAPVAPSGTLAVSGSTTRKVKVGKTTEITATPQNIQPEGATVEIVWTTEDGEIIEVTDVVVDPTNDASIATITKLAKGTEKVTATLYVNGVAVDSKVITVKNPSSGGGGGYVKPEEPTDDVTKPHTCQWPDIAATGTKSAHWAHETIDIMTINGYIKGYEDGTFKPDKNITRAEFSAIVYRILGLEVAEDGVLYDDTTGHWAEDIIATMSLPEGYGMLRGYGDGNFGPNDLITREQAVAIIARAKSAVWVAAEENAKDVFTDSDDISWWFDGEMDSAVTNGLITGYEDGSYKPLNYTTRAEACTLLARAWPEVLE